LAQGKAEVKAKAKVFGEKSDNFKKVLTKVQQWSKNYKNA